ncbi:ABC transporter ATP-binding protein [Psychrobacillus sp. FSL H8-0510]|uniref:ABC transporter ATP-binding protein n=1 Tax=Psychrobacillus sp. FSL H8-0510 TaxID=2921394 RepID=UPI0030F551BB
MNYETAIKLDNVSKIYKLYDSPKDRVKESLNPFSKKLHNEFYALKNISFELKRGETLGIIGKNGSGKSTLLKIIAGILNSSSGNTVVNGRITSLLELGAGFNPEYSGIENVFLNGSIMGYTKEQMEQKLPEIMNFADIGDYINKPVKQYSSGMFARLAFATVISFEPDILIVDEALAVGDIFFQQKCNIYMKEQMKNTTKLLVTHDMNAISNMVDRAILLSNGEIKYDGDPLGALELYTKELHTEIFSKSPVVQEDGVALTNSQRSDWHRIDESKLGGALEVKIDSYNITINQSKYKGYVKRGDVIIIKFLLDSMRSMNNLIVGYLVNDKHGNNIFGENTFTSGFKNINLSDEGMFEVEMTVVWPEIKEGHYFLTIGVGEGTHELVHVVQCWAQNVIELNNISPNKTMHALFNNNIDSIKVKRIKK